LLSASSVLETSHLTHHLHVLCELELARLDEVSLFVCNWVPEVFQRSPNVLVTESNLLFELGVGVSSLACQLVVVDVKLNPFTCLLSEGSNARVELVLSLAEDTDIFCLLLSFIRLHLSLVHFLAKGLESSTRLSHDN